ncbi:transposable element Tcb2 transposase [Trichonephila clavipes]|nr:transposable element Tcb2 transposase [Trichonephila clavipes]
MLLYISNLACRTHGSINLTPYSQPPIGVKSSRSRNSLLHATHVQTSTLQSLCSCRGKIRCKMCSPMASIEQCYSCRSTAPEAHEGPLCLLEPYEGAWLKDIWDRGAHYVCCPRRPPIDASIWSGATHDETGLQRNGTKSSLATNPDSVLAYTVTPVLIRGTMTAQRYVHDILQPHVLPLMQRLPGAIFQQDNAVLHTERVPQDCLCSVNPSLACPIPDVSPFEHI